MNDLDSIDTTNARMVAHFAKIVANNMIFKQKTTTTTHTRKKNNNNKEKQNTLQTQCLIHH